MENLLGICIPTFNRAEYLKENLEIIIEQIRKYNFPIYISDNSDNSETEAVVNELKCSYSNITYHRNITNLGFDRNVLNVVQMCETEFFWLFGDDDHIETGFIDRLVNEIKKSKYDLIIINSSTHTMDMSSLIEERHLQIYEDREYHYTEFNFILDQLGGYMTYLGCIVTRKVLWDKVSIDDLSLVEDFVHIKKIFEMLLLTDKKSLFISYPYLKLRLANATWSHRKIKVWYINWVNTIQSLDKYEHSVQVGLISRLSVKAMLYERAKGALCFNSWQSFVMNLPNITLIEKVVGLTICFLPRFLLLPWFLDGLKKSSNKYLYYELTGRQLDAK